MQELRKKLQLIVSLTLNSAQSDKQTIRKKLCIKKLGVALCLKVEFQIGLKTTICTTLITDQNRS